MRPTAKLRRTHALPRSSTPRRGRDARSGSGADRDRPGVVLNDAWCAAAFWSASISPSTARSCSLTMGHSLVSYGDMRSRAGPKRTSPGCGSPREAEHSRLPRRPLHLLWHVLPEEPVLAVLDPSIKGIGTAQNRVSSRWREHVSGEVFIP